MEIPDFGKVVTALNSDVELECKAIVPGLSLNDLVFVYNNEILVAKPEDYLSSNPKYCPQLRALNKVINIALKAIFDNIEKYVEIS